MAKRLATVIDNTMMMQSIGCQNEMMLAKTFVRIVRAAKAAAPLEITLR